MGAIIKEDQQDAEIAIRQIRTSLSKIGLTFGQVPPMMEESGDLVLPLTLLVDVSVKTLIHHIMSFLMVLVIKLRVD